MSTNSHMSDFRFSAFYFLYFAAVGTMLPYWSIYLDSVGVDAFGIGLFVALVTSVKIIAPPLWAWACDRSSQPLRIVRWSGAGATLCFLPLFFTTDFNWLVVAIFGFNFFWAAQLPQFDAVALRTLGSRRHQYGRLRLWGSVGFILAVLVSGWLVDLVGARIILTILFALYLATLFITIGVKESPAQLAAVNRRINWRPDATTLIFFTVGFLMQASHGPFYTFFTIHLTGIGYTNTNAGLLWALGVISEVAMYYFMHRVFARIGVVRVLTISFCVATLRWLLLAIASDMLPVLLLSQLLHAVTFAAWHAASIQFIYDHFPEHMRHRGQALHGSLCFALGTAVGGLLAGYVWSNYGPVAAWNSAAVMAALAMVLSLLLSVKAQRSFP